MANDIKALTADELYLLHLEVTTVLKKKLVAQKEALEEQRHDCIRPMIARSRNHVGPIHR